MDDDYFAVERPFVYIVLDDVEVPPLLLRKGWRRPPEEREKMAGDALEILHKRWEFITSGEGEDIVGRNDRFVDVTHEVHEFA